MSWHETHIIKQEITENAKIEHSSPESRKGRKKGMIEQSQRIKTRGKKKQ